MSASLFPIVLFGRHVDIAIPVAEHLKPDVEILHFAQSPEEGAKDLPVLLKGEEIVPAPNEVGTGNFGKLPVAFVFGGGYSEADLAKVREACKGLVKIPFLHADPSKSSYSPFSPEYPPVAAAAIKAKIVELKEAGKLEVEETVRF